MKRFDAVAGSLGAAKNCVGVIDDDVAVREGLCLMLETLQIEVHAYTSAADYLADPVGRECCTCLVLDVRMPGMSGIELQRHLLKQARVPAIVFVTGHGDIPMAVEAMRNGAVDFLQKPFNEQQLLDSVYKALALEERLRKAQKASETVTARLVCLTPKEREVLAKLIQGLRSREIAVELGRATKTIEEHRANIMHKMHASTIAELVSMCNLAKYSANCYGHGPYLSSIPG
jgi:two-component system, LuxR family, response regulator FixJ